MSTIYCGPATMEFGWEVCTWIGHCRAASRGYDNVIVSTFTEMHPLYADFATSFMPHRTPTRALDWRDLSKIDYDMPEDVDKHIKPFKQYRVPGQEFNRYGHDHPITTYKYLIHARNIGRGVGKNCPVEILVAISDGLDGLVASIGRDPDLHIPGTDDLRDLPLRMLTRFMAGSRVVIGGSSGVMHLATHCDVPVIVWGDGRTYFGELLEVRYTKTWNPFGSPVVYIYDKTNQRRWNPEPDEVLDAIQTHGWI